MRLAIAAGVASVLLMGTFVARADDYQPAHHAHHCQAHHQGHAHHCDHCDHDQDILERVKARIRHGLDRGRVKYREKRDEFIADYHQAHMWPDPYRCQARYSATAPFEIQIANAWAEKMTNLNTFFFDPDSHHLTPAGREHVRWILQQAPASRRSINVQQGAVPSITEARLANVREVVAEISGHDDTIAIAVSERVPYLGDGIDVDVASRLYYSSFPLPRLPGTTTAESSATAPAGLPGN